MIFKVGVEPLTPSSASVPGSNGDQPRADAAAPNPRSHDGIEDEGAGPAIPRHVDKPCQFTALPGTHPAQAVPLNPGAPADAATAVTETLRMQDTDSSALEVAAPLIGDRHPVIVGATPSARQPSTTARPPATGRSSPYQSPTDRRKITIYCWSTRGLPWHMRS